MDSYNRGVQIRDMIDPKKFRDYQLRRLEREAQQRKEIERLNAELPLGPVTKNLEWADLAEILQLDHVNIGLIEMPNKSRSRSQDLPKSRWSESVRWLARAIHRGGLNNSPSLELRKATEKYSPDIEGKYFPDIEGCVILALDESEIPEKSRIESEWIKNPDGTQAYGKPSDLPMFSLMKWLVQRVNSLYREISRAKSYPHPPIAPVPNPIDALIAAAKVEKILEVATPKGQEFIRTHLQTLADYTDLTGNQALTKTRRAMKISDAAGYQLLYRIKKIKKVC